MTALAAVPVAAFTTCPAPWGLLHVAATAAGIVAVDLGSETPDFVDGLARRLHGRVLPGEDGEVPAEWRATLSEAGRQMGEWFAGERRSFDLPIDLRVSDWDRLVLTGAARLQFGETVGYGELARRIGRPGAAQAVGGAMGRNPLPILIPCHRVIAGDGTLGGYGGSTYADRRAALAIKRRLLALEGVQARGGTPPGVESTAGLDSEPEPAETTCRRADELQRIGSMSIPESPNDVFLFQALMESTADSIYFKDRQCRLLRVSRKMAQDLGYADPADIIGKTDVDLFGEAFGQTTRRDDERIMDSNRPIVGVIESRQLDNGRTNWTLTTKLPLHDASGNVIGLVGITREINEMRQTEAALQHLATHDTLTDLPNRFLMTDRLDQLLSRAKRSATAFAVLFMDIDRFKDFNDSYGHEFGDLLLRAISRRLQESVRHSDTVARFGGDEFVIILETVHQIEGAETVAKKVLAALARPFALQRHRVRAHVSIGVSVYPENGEDAETLVRAADYAMYLAKREGGNRYVKCLPGMPTPGEAPQRE
jgi:O-6-methylguanine DNA methyltransferase